MKFQFCVVVFGVNGSQHLLKSVVRYHDRKFPEKVAKIFYVDDFNFTVQSNAEGEETLVTNINFFGSEVTLILAHYYLMKSDKVVKSFVI